MNDSPPRVLFISYAYPPTGGGGVQRSVKFTKYLPEFGWHPTVLTVANPSVPVLDEDLAEELRRETTILRARTLEPSYAAKQKLVTPGKPTRFSLRRLIKHAGMSMLQPDPQVLWNPFAYRAAKRELRRTPHQAIYATGPPFSSFLLGHALKRQFGLPLVLDFRDEWLLSSQYLENHARSDRGFRRQLAMFQKVLRSADAVIATTKASEAELARYLQQTASDATAHCLYNGYDEEDITPIIKKNLTDGAGQDRAGQSRRLRIVYTGTLWNLTDVTPLVSAMLQLAKQDPQTAKNIELIFAGRRTPDQDVILHRLDGTPIQLRLHDYLPHGESLRLAASADLLLLLLADSPGAERVVPAKMFEYMAIGKPILALCGEGETATLLQQHGYEDVFLPRETDKVCKWFAQKVQERPAPNIENPATIGAFSRRELTKQLVRILESVATIDGS